MSRTKVQTFSDKHSPEATVNNLIKNEVLVHAKSGELACAVAFKIGAEINKPPAEIGKTLDLMDYKLVKCQLGLFVYKPEKKIVKPKTAEDPKLEEAIRAALVDEKLSCHDAWAIAQEYNVSKMAVSAACEALKIKIQPCQLGAF